MRVAFPGLKIGLAFLIGCLIAFQGLPAFQQSLFGEFAPPVVSIVLGGLYALEKYILKSPAQGEENK